ncbi:MAG: GGDEF domain-containing protein, partial [Syntrophomonadaceae bacterium]
KNIVATIKKSIRNTDIFARWGGEEFAILLPNTDICQAENMAERMRICIRNNLYDPVKSITCSFGIAALEKDDTAQTLLRKADELLLQAKASGKDRVIRSAFE